MTDHARKLPGRLTPEAARHHLADGLSTRFTACSPGRPSTVTSSSPTRHSPRRRRTAHLPVLAGRFATERLTALLPVEVPLAGMDRAGVAAAHGHDDDPAGLGLGEVRAIRNDIDVRVRALLAELQPANA